MLGRWQISPQDAIGFHIDVASDGLTVPVDAVITLNVNGLSDHRTSTTAAHVRFEPNGGKQWAVPKTLVFSLSEPIAAQQVAMQFTVVLDGWHWVEGANLQMIIEPSSATSGSEVVPPTEPNSGSTTLGSTDGGQSPKPGLVFGSTIFVTQLPEIALGGQRPWGEPPGNWTGLLTTGVPTLIPLPQMQSLGGIHMTLGGDGSAANLAIHLLIRATERLWQLATQRSACRLERETTGETAKKLTSGLTT